MSKSLTENIKDYSDCKILYTLLKPHSPHTIVFVEDRVDPWFVHVITYKTKSGIVSDTSMIIAADIKTWKGHLEALGHIEKK